MDHGEKAGKECVVYILWNKQTKRIHVVDEWRSSTASTSAEDAEGILDMLIMNGTTPDAIDMAVGDINTGGKEARGAKVNDMIGNHMGLRIRRPTKGAGSIAWGTRLMNSAFKDGILTVSPKCKYLIKCLNAWDGDRRSNHKDVIDALRYIVVPIIEEMRRGTAEYDRLLLLHPGQGGNGTGNRARVDHLQGR